MTIKIYLFGPPRITRDEQAIPLNHRKAWALLAYLAVTARPHSRDALATLLWPDYGQSDARSHLRRELARLRKLLGAAYFDADREQMQLVTHPPGQEPVDLDVADFQRLFQSAQACSHAANSGCPTCRPHLTQAADLYTDHFLTGFTLPDSPDFDDWQFFQVDELRVTQGFVLEKLVTSSLPEPVEDNEGVTLHYARRWVTHDPLHEPAQRALITLYAQTGQQAAALRQYESCLRLLADELGVPPTEETAALGEAVRARRISDKKVEEGRSRGKEEKRAVNISSPPLPLYPSTPLPPPHPLPTHTTPFIGRQRELDHFGRQLRQHGMAVICGMPGVGKTALALALAQQAAPRQLIFWHTCQPEEGVDAVVWRLAAFLAERGQGALWQMLQPEGMPRLGPPPLAARIDYLVQMLQHEHYLLCLDDLHNLESEAGAADLLQRLMGLAQSGRLMLIITSRRQPTLAALASPKPLAGLTLADTRDLLRKHNLTLSADLLHQLHAETEGNGQFITLAIHALSRSDDANLLLNRLAAAADMERHLLLLVNSLLSDEEWAVMAAVAILEGYPGTRGAIEAIVEEGRVRDALLRLSERYLLNVERTAQGQLYQTHALVQKFFYSGLNRRERQTMHRRAAHHYETEETDVLRAAQHYLRAGLVEDAARLLTTQLYAVIGQGAVRALGRLLVRVPLAGLERRLRAAVYVARGKVGTILGEYAKARADYAKALKVAEALPAAQVLLAQICLGMADVTEHEYPQRSLHWAQRGATVLAGAEVLAGAPEPAAALESNSDPELAAELQVKMGGIYAALGDFNGAVQTLRRAQTLLSTDAGFLHIAAHENLGVAHFYLGNMAEACAQWEQGLALAKRLPQPFKAVGLLNNLGAYKMVAGPWTEAVALFEEGLDEAVRLGMMRQQTLFLLNLGILHTWQGDDAAAEARLQRLFALTAQRELDEHAINGAYSLADLRLRQGRLEEAATLLAEAEAKGARLESNYQLPEIYRLWAQVRQAWDDLDAAREYADQSIALAQELGMARDEGIGRGILGQVLAAQNQFRKAIAEFEASLALLTDTDLYEAARTQMAWGRALMAVGKIADAQPHLAAAQQTFSALGARRELAAQFRQQYL